MDIVYDKKKNVVFFDDDEIQLHFDQRRSCKLSRIIEIANDAIIKKFGNVVVEFYEGEEYEYGYFDTSKRNIHINIKPFIEDKEMIKFTIGHELQHAAQYAEGRICGSDVEWEEDLFKHEKVFFYGVPYISNLGWELYFHNEGEVEARVAAREDAVFTADRNSIKDVYRILVEELGFNQAAAMFIVAQMFRNWNINNENNPICGLSYCKIIFFVCVIFKYYYNNNRAGP